MELVAVSSRPRRGVAALTAQEIERIRFFFVNANYPMYAAQSTHLLIYDQILLSSWKPFQEDLGGRYFLSIPCANQLQNKVQYAAFANENLP